MLRGIPFQKGLQFAECEPDAALHRTKGHVEPVGNLALAHAAEVGKANDLLVARRQKQWGVQWSGATSDGLAALRTLLLNGGWERYWVDGEVLPLMEAA